MVDPLNREFRHPRLMLLTSVALTCLSAFLLLGGSILWRRCHSPNVLNETHVKIGQIFCCTVPQSPSIHGERFSSSLTQPEQKLQYSEPTLETTDATELVIPSDEPLQQSKIDQGEEAEIKRKKEDEDHLELHKNRLMARESIENINYPGLQTPSEEAYIRKVKKVFESDSLLEIDSLCRKELIGHLGSHSRYGYSSPFTSKSIVGFREPAHYFGFAFAGNAKSIEIFGYLCDHVQFREYLPNLTDFVAKIVLEKDLAYTTLLIQKLSNQLSKSGLQEVLRTTDSFGFTLMHHAYLCRNETLKHLLQQIDPMLDTMHSIYSNKCYRGFRLPPHKTPKELACAFQEYLNWQIALLHIQGARLNQQEHLEGASTLILSTPGLKPEEWEHFDQVIERINNVDQRAGPLNLTLLQYAQFFDKKTMAEQLIQRGAQDFGISLHAAFTQDGFTLMWDERFIEERPPRQISLQTLIVNKFLLGYMFHRELCEEEISLFPKNLEGADNSLFARRLFQLIEEWVIKKGVADQIEFPEKEAQENLHQILRKICLETVVEHLDISCIANSEGRILFAEASKAKRYDLMEILIDHDLKFRHSVDSEKSEDECRLDIITEYMV